MCYKIIYMLVIHHIISLQLVKPIIYYFIGAHSFVDFHIILTERMSVRKQFSVDGVIYNRLSLCCHYQTVLQCDWLYILGWLGWDWTGGLWSHSRGAWAALPWVWCSQQSHHPLQQVWRPPQGLCIHRVCWERLRADGHGPWWVTVQGQTTQGKHKRIVTAPSYDHLIQGIFIFLPYPVFLPPGYAEEDQQAWNFHQQSATTRGEDSKRPWEVLLRLPTHQTTLQVLPIHAGIALRVSSQVRSVCSLYSFLLSLSLFLDSSITVVPHKTNALWLRLSSFIKLNLCGKYLGVSLVKPF